MRRSTGTAGEQRELCVTTDQGTGIDRDERAGGVGGGDEDKGPIITRLWVQLAALVFFVGFTILGFLAVRTYQVTPPIPDEVITENGVVVFTGDDIMAGQGVFVANGLMEYGSIFGHGAYLGPDYTAEYLHRAAVEVLGRKSGPGAGDEVAAEFKQNTYDPSTGQMTLTLDQAAAFDSAREYYGGFFGDPTTVNALRPNMISDPEDIKKLTAFFAWTAWAAAAERPGADYSYTNNWPPEELVRNTPTAPVLIWSALSLMSLIGGIGILMAIFGRWENQVGWQSAKGQPIRLRRPDDVSLTPSQRATVFLFTVMAALFLIQTLVGGAAQHYRASPSTFYGLDLAVLLPFNLARTWHLQLAILWVATSFLAAGIFLAPMISGREPRKQHWLVYGLLGALGIVVVGSLIGEFAGIHGVTTGVAQFFANQGFEYLDLGRFWQILLTVGLFFWVVILWRTLRKRLQSDKRIDLPWIFFFAALMIPACYAVGLLVRTGSSFSINDFWRFFVVHLWVEQFLELFTTVMVAVIFVVLGVTSKKLAVRLIFLDVIIYSIGGIAGTMHHVYFSGQAQEFMAVGAVFSALEVMPLTFLTVEAWRFIRLGRNRLEPDAKPFMHKWALMFFIAVGFWNFVGAGIMGFLINLPVVSYYEIGTALTANHAHAAFLGVYGMMAAGLALFCLRYIIPEKSWSERAAKLSFWSMNIGLVWMVVTSLFPLGIMQMFRSVSQGYWSARSAEFLQGSAQRVIEWLRLPGDVVIILGGALPLLWICWLGIRGFFATDPTDNPTDQLYEDAEPSSDRPSERVSA